jgi:uncharacterized lipoprotein YmbA
MRKAAIAILLAVLMSGCGSTHVKRYFEIRSLVSAEPALPKVERRVLVEPVRVDSLYDDVRIVYRVSPFELKYYPYEFWSEKPGKQVGAAMIEFLREKKVFPWVGQTVGIEAPDLVLRSRLHALEEIDHPDVWEARLAMDFEFADPKTGAPVVSWTFDRKAQMGKSVGALAPVLSRLLEEELEKAVWQLAHALEKK